MFSFTSWPQIEGKRFFSLSCEQAQCSRLHTGNVPVCVERTESALRVCACTIDINNARELLSVKRHVTIFFFAGECRTLKFKSVIQNRVLTGHVLKSYVVASKDDCELKCYLEADCMSINLELEANGKYLCELSGSDHDMHPKDLEVRYGFIYGPTKVISCFCKSGGIDIPKQFLYCLWK